MNKKWLPFGLTLREIIISSIGAIISTLIQSGVTLLTGTVKWDELIILRAFAFLVCQFVLVAVVILVTRNSIQKKVTSLYEKNHAEEISKILHDHENQMAKLEEKYRNDFVKITDQQHRFIHNARDLTVKMGGPVRNKIRSPSIIPEGFRPTLELLLDKMESAFKPLVPADTKIFTAIRERHGDDFITIARGGDTNKDARQKDTEPIHIKNHMIEDLLRSFHSGTDCVIITGQGYPNWHIGRKNNEKKEDLSVLMGAVFSKEWSDNQFKPIQMEWLLCVNANKFGVFKEEHKPMMKCFTDVCGLMINIFIRHQPPDTSGENRKRQKPPPSGPTGHTWSI